MNELKSQEEFEFIKDKGITIIIFTFYMISLLFSSKSIGNGNNSSASFGILFAATISMLFFVPKISKFDKNLLIANAVFFTMYPIANYSIIFKVIMIICFSLFTLKFTTFISNTYLSKSKQMEQK